MYKRNCELHSAYAPEQAVQKQNLEIRHYTKSWHFLKKNVQIYFQKYCYSYFSLFLKEGF